MKIVSLTAENVKRLRAVHIEPDGNVVVVAGANAQGKQQPVTEPVLTPDGWRHMGDLRVGDHVIGSDGQPTRVNGVYPQNDRRVFRVQMADGTSTRCGADHLWTVQRWAHRRLVTETLTTDQLVQRGLRVGSHRRWSVPLITGPAAFTDTGENLPVDPYTLGVILGDGHIETTGYVTITSHDPEIFDWVKVEGWRDPTTLGSGHWSRPLVHLGLAGRRAWEKFIPAAYLTASVEDRRALLQGLMDSDGTPLESWASFTTTSEDLADGVVDLASSLGWHATKRDRGGRRYRYLGELREGRMAWEVTVKGDEAPFRLDRKSRRWKRAVQRPVPRRFIDSIEQVLDEDSVCIRVANVDGLYVTNDWIVTHNTSVLDSIWLALGGAPAGKATTKPIRDGQKKAQVTLDLGDITVTRTWDSKGSKLSVVAADGAKYSSPQGLLDSLVGRLSFDPLAFAQQDDKTQRRTLQDLVDLPFDPDVLDDQRQGLFEQRTAVNRDLKQLEAQLAAIPRPATDVPAEEVGAGELVARIRAVHDDRAACLRTREAFAAASAAVEAAKEQLRQALTAQRDLSNEVAHLPDELPDVSVLEAQLADLDQVNAAVREARAHRELTERVEQARASSEALTGQISDLDEMRAKALAEATMPLPGLAFDDTGVTYQGQPLKQASGAEQLRVSLAMAMALNPRIRVIRITDASLLDSKSMAIVREMCDAADFQCWLEVVDETGQLGVVIEDGSVVAVDGQRVSA